MDRGVKEMRRVVKNVKGEQVIIEQFESFKELVHTNDKRQQNFGDSRNEKGGSWAGCKSYDEAERLLTHGWNEKVEEMKQSIKKAKTGTVNKVSFKNDVVGYAPIVPLAIQGVPNCMINNVRVPKKAKVVNIQACMEFNSNVNTEEVIEWGSQLVNKIINLENNGFRVKLEYISCFSRGDGDEGIHICRVPMKNENQPLDLKRIMFPLCHVGMLRIMMFDWYERLPDAIMLYGHGQALYSQPKNRIEFTTSLIKEKNTYFIKFRDDIEEVFKEVR